MGIGTDQVGQQVRVGDVALGARHPVPLPVSGGLHRVHREHLIPRRHQRRHPQALPCLDPDQHLRPVRIGIHAQVPADQLVQPGHSLSALRQAGPR
jgi:hypothetical protein